MPLARELPGECHRRIEVRDAAIELALVNLPQHFADGRSGTHAEREQVPSLDERIGRRVLDAERAGAVEEGIHRGTVEAAAAPFTIRLRYAGEQFEIYFLRETA